MLPPEAYIKGYCVLLPPLWGGNRKRRAGQHSMDY